MPANLAGMRAARSIASFLAAGLIAAIFPILPAAAECRPSGGAILCVDPPERRDGPFSVVAHIDTGVNPYAPAFRAESALAYKHPSTYIPGYPKDAQPLKLSLDLPYEKAVEKDTDKWKLLRRGQLYWIPGTKIIGAISFGAGGTYCPPTKIPTVVGLSDGTCSEHVILDDHGHGSMTGSRATGAPNSLAPGARLVTIEGLGAQGVEWAAEQGWIDVQTNSWLAFVPQPVPNAVTDAFAAATETTFTMAASGNGTAFVAGFAPTPTYVLSTAPPGVVLVGGHDNGKMTLWAGASPHVVADAYAGYTAIGKSSEKMRPDPMACCTSAASPYAAGGAAALIEEARRILKDYSTGAENGVLARGRCGAVKKGPLADGDFTLEELRDLFFHTAEARPTEGKDDGEIHWLGAPGAPTHTDYGPGGNPFCLGCTTTPVPWSTVPEQAQDAAYTFVGYGAINERSVALGEKVLRGKAEMPSRANADAQYELDQTVRELFFGGASSGSLGELVEVRACVVARTTR